LSVEICRETAKPDLIEEKPRRSEGISLKVVAGEIPFGFAQGRLSRG
jgi:hypothetical protein